MKVREKLYSILFLYLLLGNTAFSSGGHGEHGGHGDHQESKIKEGSGVTAFDEHKGFQIDEKTKSYLGIHFQVFQGELKRNSIVKIKDHSFFYRKREDWIQRIEIHKLKESIRSGDEIAIEGIVFLRMIESDLTSENVGHAH